MFLVRSAFWLALAYLVINPDPGGIATAASAATQQAATAGRQLIVGGIAAEPCLIIGCAGGGAAAAEIAGRPQVQSALVPADPIPMPRPRPPRLG